MKRMFVLLLMVCTLLTIFGQSALADYDLSTMDDSELMALWEDVNRELEKRAGLTEKGDHIQGSWYEHGLGRLLPDPYPIMESKPTSDPYKRLNSDQAFTEVLEGCTEKDWAAYVDACRAFGFTEDSMWLATLYSGSNKEGINLVVYLEQDSIGVMVTNYQ